MTMPKQLPFNTLSISSTKKKVIPGKYLIPNINTVIHLPNETMISK